MNVLINKLNYVLMEEVSWALKYWLEVTSYVLLKICTVPLAMYTE